MPNNKTINWIALFASNFFGVFNDNLLKNSIIFVSVAWVLPAWLNQSQLITVVSAALILPYLVFSPYAGNLSVRISKLGIFRFFKLLEIPIMLLAAVAFYFENIYLAILGVLLMGIQSSMYSPSKYGLIRDVGGEKKVAFGSGVFETMAFLGILLGTVVASTFSDNFGVWGFIALFLIIAVVGYISTLLIKVEEMPIEVSKASNNPFVFISQSYMLAKSYKDVNPAIFGSSAFWLIGGMLQMNLVIHTSQFYSAGNTTTGLIMAMAAIGIAVGCTVAAKVAGNTTGKNMILPGIAGMVFFLAIITFFDLDISVFAFCVFGTAFSGGFFQVPCLAIIQKSNSGRKLGDLFAYLNLTTFVFVSFGTFLFWLTTQLTNQNSFVVFAVIMILCIAVFMFFNKKFKQTHH
jgi:acyl-[acyl-carrier-protein]-phospholipid O-acyltransferase/long-chain-fatty-acid--[acyl-carrier-protein] ligase